MIQDLVNIFKNIALRHKGVKTFRYQSSILNNSQNNFGTFQVYLDDTSYHNLNITTNIFTSEFNLYVIGHPSKDKDSILQIQNEAFTIAIDIIGYLDNMPDYRGILSIHDYSIIAFAHYTDDDSAGVKLSITLESPSPLNLCTLEDNFNDEPYEEDEEQTITIDDNEVGDITISAIKLPKNRNC